VSGRRFAVVSGGGTAGHVVPALAVARALGRPPDEIELVTSARGHDPAALQREGFGVTALPGRGLSRRLRPRDLARNVVALAALSWASLRVIAAFRRWRPRAVVTVGGYASVPAGVAAVLWRVPLVVVNVDAVPGLANRILGRFAAACAVGFSGTALPRAVVTGAPVRPDVRAASRGSADRAAARDALGLPERPTVALFGGSLGARRLNLAALELVSRWVGREDRALYHVTGRRDWDDMSSRSDGAQRAGVVHRMVPFEDDMAHLYTAADVVVCRAGALTVAEVALAGVPAVLVPLPGAPGDHQTANAGALVTAGAAVLLPDDQCDGDRLGDLVDGLLDDPEALARMGAAARSVGHDDAADRVAALVEEVLATRAR
jgi:undecaprenyldiphospho-muramoylpentapeptide beta-N-acetylglucosaminyltransferase